MPNYILLERIELNASAASVTFSNIPQTGYTDLKVVVSARSDYAGVQASLYISPNGLTTNGSSRVLFGSGSTAASYTYTNINMRDIAANTSTASTFGNTEVYIPNYNSTTTYKSFSADSVGENNATAAPAGLSAGLWSSNSAITSLQLSTDGNFMQYSTFSLYGLAAVGTTPVIAPKASGGSIYSDGTYWYHAFRTSGTFTPQTSLSCDALVVAGGGGGNTGGGGGGGAGGLLAFTSQSISTAQTVTVGAGGAVSSNGADSQIGALTLVKGGGGGGGNPGLTGGSGGGGGSTYSGGAATSGQGFAGGAGAGLAFPNDASGGGGGAGAVGATGTSATGGAGGIGSSAYSSWGAATISGQLVSSTRYYAGGGGGYGRTTSGAGGSGGGGACNTSTGATAGTVNTGGGGGAFQDAGGSSAGGSGIVIIRYTIA